MNSECLHGRALYRSAEAEKLGMKFTIYGFDMLCLVGELRFKRHMTRQEIANEWNERGVKTTDRNVQLLYERYLTLLGASTNTHLRTVLGKLQFWSQTSLSSVPAYAFTEKRGADYSLHCALSNCQS